MKIYMQKINWYYLSISIISLITIYPAVAFLTQTLHQVELGTKGSVTTDQLNHILNMPLSDPTILAPFIIGLFVWTSNIVLSLVFLYKKKVAPSFAYTTLLLGGLGAHLITWLILYLKSLVQFTTTTKTKTIMHFSVLGLLLMFLSLPFAFTTFAKGHNSAYEGKPIQLSLNAAKPNLIEVFTDGFWRRAQTKPISKDKRFKDFKIYDKYYTFGKSTYYSLPTMLGSVAKNNYYSLLQDKSNGVNEENYVRHMQESGFVSAFKEHMNDKYDYFKQNSAINPIGLSNVAEYNANTAGTPSYLQEKMPNLNITNWVGARDGLGFGIHNASPDVNSYKWLNKNFTISKTGAPSRIYISDMITHPAYMSKRDGSFLMEQASKYDQWALLRNTLANLFAKLKTIKQGNVNAYDNSMIIVYGDHKDHSFTSRKRGIEKLTEDFESLMILKYPNQKQPAQQISDRVVWAPQLNKIIDNFMQHPNSNNLEQYIEQGANFAPDSKHWIGNGTYIVRAGFKLNPSYNNGQYEFEPKYSLQPIVNTLVNFKEQPQQVIDEVLKEVY